MQLLSNSACGVGNLNRQHRDSYRYPRPPLRIHGISAMARAPVIQAPMISISTF